jgi:hypothetical protein
MAPRANTGIGCLGSLLGLVAFIAVVAAVIFVGAIALAVVGAVLVVGVVVLAIDRLLLAISPKRRARRATLQRSFMIWGPGSPGPSGASGASGPIIEATAHLEEPGREEGSEGPAG